MATILTTFGSGGVGLYPGPSNATPSLATALRDIADDLTALRTAVNANITDTAAVRTKLIATLGKLDADAGVTDTNYTALESPAAATAVAVSALLTIKG